MENNTIYIFYILFLESKILLNGRTLGNKFSVMQDLKINTFKTAVPNNAYICRIATAGYKNNVLKIPLFEGQNNNSILSLQKKILSNKAFTLLNQRMYFAKKNVEHPQLVWTLDKGNYVIVKFIGLSSTTSKELKIDDYNKVYKIPCIDENNKSFHQISKSIITLVTESEIQKGKIEEVLLPPWISENEIETKVISLVNAKFLENPSIFKNFNIKEDLLNLQYQYEIAMNLEDSINKDNILNAIGDKFMLLKNFMDININEN